MPTEADLDALVEWRNHPDAMRWLLCTDVDPTAHERAWRSTAEDSLDHRVSTVADGVVVGSLSRAACRQGAALSRTGERRAVGYLVGAAHHGRGHATEMVRAALDLAFGDLGLRRGHRTVLADNVGSWRFMEKAGVRRDQHGIRGSWHAEHRWVDGLT